MDLWKGLHGMVQVQLVSASLDGTLEKLNEAGIELFDLQYTDALTGSYWIRRRDWRTVRQLCESKDGKVRILRRSGVYWPIKRLIKRPVLVAGLVFLLILSLYLPSRIFFVRVEGNTRIPDRQIFAAAEEIGVAFGASRREVRSEKVKNALLSALPQLQWAGVNTSGCVATICVREREPQVEQPEPGGVSSIAAVRDGFILSATATRGNLLVQPGQTVVEGQLLISGYTDCGISIRAEQAEGEVYAQTSRTLDVVMPNQWRSQQPSGVVKKKISLLIGKKRINLWKDSGISGDSCGRMYEEYYITLPGDFQLPVALCIDRYVEYDQEELLLEETIAREALEEFAEGYLLKQMSAGRILQTQGNIQADEGAYTFHGTYVCREMIGRVRQEQIGEANGENS